MIDLFVFNQHLYKVAPEVMDSVDASVVLPLMCMYVSLTTTMFKGQRILLYM